jgi:hypothetical protein
MSPEEDDGGWKEWSQYIKQGIKELKLYKEDLQKEVNALKVEIGVLKTKMALWGGLGATIATIVVQLMFIYFKKYIGGG